MKLSSTNYGLWEPQFRKMVEMLGFTGFIDRTVPSPPPTLPDRVEKNPSYLLWRRSDRLLRGWIVGSLGEDVLLGYAVGLETSFDVRNGLEKLISESIVRQICGKSGHGGSICSHRYDPSFPP